MIYWMGVAAVGLFYLIILAIGFWAARKTKRDDNGETNVDDLLLAGRNIGLFVGIFTMTATWVGGGYINGTAEAIYDPAQGLLWCTAPLGYALSLIFGGIFFATRMRELGYVTMLDPFQNKYGERMCGLLFIPALLGELFWTAAILSALGATIHVIVEVDKILSIIISACIALVYTLFGGLYSVAYTDVVQLFCIFVGLWIAVPFAITNAATKSIVETFPSWRGSVAPADIATHLDGLLMLTFGGIPWQVYFQRVLACKTANQARILSFVASFGCILMAIPAVLLGAVAKDADWKSVNYNDTTPEGNVKPDNYYLILPLVLRYLCHPVVSFVALGAISAAVMSSSDSSVLSAASMFARNFVRSIFWRSATDRQTKWVMRGGVILVGSAACLLGILVDSIYGLWFLCSDLVYVILFPQLISVIHIPFTNTYGSLVGYFVGLALRLAAGETILKLRPLIEYPYHYIEKGVVYQRFPIKTFSMLCSFTSILIVSFLTDSFFKNNIERLKYDIFKCYKERSTESGSIRISNRLNRPSIRFFSNTSRREIRVEDEIDDSQRGETVAEQAGDGNVDQRLKSQNKAELVDAIVDA